MRRKRSGDGGRARARRAREAASQGRPGRGTPVATVGPLTISVMEAGRMLGIQSKDSAYAAAHAGVFPVIKIGRRRWRVPVRAIERMLSGIDTKSLPVANFPTKVKRRARN